MLVIIDIETCGLDLKDQILEIAAIEYSTNRRFHEYVKYDYYHINGELLDMHEQLLKRCHRSGVPFAVAIDNLCSWLPKVPTFCGKNVASFDLPRLALPVKYRHRMLDVGSMYWDGVEEVLPDLSECLRRAGLPPEVKHDAMSDCQAVYDLMKGKYVKRSV